MLEDIAAMVFAFGVPIALAVTFHKNETGTPPFVRFLALASILIALVFLVDAHKQGDEARRQLANAQRSLNQLQGQ